MDDMLRVLTIGTKPTAPDEYYYKLRNNKKMYYTKHNNKVIPLKDIPTRIDVSKIQKYSDKYIYVSYCNDIKKLEDSVEFLNSKVALCITFIAKLKDDLSKLEHIDANINENDPRFYYKGIGNNSTIYYQYSDYISADDYNYKTQLFNFKRCQIKSPKHKACKTVPSNIKYNISIFNDAYIFLSKECQILSAERSLDDLNKKIHNAKNKIKDISALCEKLNIYISDPNAINRLNAQKLKEDVEYKNKHIKAVKIEKEKFNSYFNRKYNWYKEPPRPPPNQNNTKSNQNNTKSTQNNTKSNIEILKSFNIDDKKSWKSWLRKYHPDKGGNIPDCQSVITAGRSIGW